jgi:taurine dioxygenase
MDVHQLEPFGVELDLDASKPLAPDASAEVRALFARHHLLVFRGRPLTWEEQARFVEHLGPIVRNGSEPDRISTEGDESGLGRVGLSYHSDLSFCDAPHPGLSLHALDVVDGETSTRFANGLEACGRLAADRRSRLEGRRARHVLGGNAEGRNHVPYIDQFVTEHPLIKLHPRTGQEILFVSYQLTDRIVDMDPDDSEAMLDALFADLYAPEHVYEHRWFRGDLVIWDNLAVQHARDNLTGVGTRILQRVTLAEHGVFDMFPSLRAS